MTDLSTLNVIKGSLPSSGSVIVLEFWATWCPPCRASIPHLTELAHKYKSAGVEFVGITNEPNETMIKQFVTRMGAQMDYTVAIDSVGKVTEEYMGKFGVGSIPHAFIVNRKGEVVYHDHPMNPEFETQLAKVAQEKPVPEVNVPDVKGMSDEQLAELSVGELKAVLRKHGVDYSDCLEKADLIRKINATCK